MNQAIMLFNNNNLMAYFSASVILLVPLCSNAALYWPNWWQDYFNDKSSLVLFSLGYFYVYIKHKSNSIKLLMLLLHVS